MAKTRLCMNDVEDLMSAMKSFGQMLEDVGVEGVASIGFSTNGDISGVFTLNAETSLLIDIVNDGNEFSVKYND